MLELFHKGGPIMWPLLACSLLTLTVVIERLIFVVTENSRRSPQVVEAMLAHLASGDAAAARREAEGSQDHVARVLAYALGHREQNPRARHSACQRPGARPI